MPNPPISLGELNDVPAVGSPIASQWTQEVTARAVHRFANAAARDAQYTPARGLAKDALCIVGGALQVYDGSKWVEPGSIVSSTLGAQSGISGPTPINGSGFALRSVTRVYLVTIMVELFKSSTTGDVGLHPTYGGTPGDPASRYWAINSPGRTTAYASWIIAGNAGATGGTFVVAPAAGTVDVVAGFVYTQDVGGVYV